MDAKFAGKGKEFGREEWDQLLGHCRAITDTPCVIFYEELLAAYPDARVILTIRDSTEQWYNSACRTIIGNWIDVYIAPPATLWGRLQRLFKPLTPVDQMCRRLHKYCMHGFMYKRGKQFYEEYNAVIQRIVPQENLLVFNVKQGWEPLCKFLGKEIPPWEFPRGNDTETFLANMAPIHSYNHWIVMRRMWRTVGLVAAAMACLWAWLWK